MSPQRWRQVEELYHSALELEPGLRAVFLAEACQGDSDLEREVESLLEHAETQANRLDRAAWEGAQVGPYQILGRLGAGGMGEVWKARDSRLDRIVAIKRSKARFSDRFEREARAVAALNHPYICTLYDVGPDYLVMEYVDGKPLVGPVPLAEALRYADQIAQALEAAHRKGVIHRDLKPANILVTKQGVKLLDFGVARRVATAPAAKDASTAAGPLTAEGVILGTLEYMAPEQVEGKEADARTDVFAFGCVLYEILTGKQAFEGKTPASLVAAILRADPAPVSAIQPAAPAALDRVLEGCLAKNPDERWQSATDVRRALLLAAGTQPAARPALRRWIWIGLAGATVILLAWSLTGRNQPLHSQHMAPVRFVVPFLEGTVNPGAVGTMTVAPLAVSPDGTAVAMVEADATGRSYVWIRHFGSISPVRLDSTIGAISVFWSPDSRQLGFTADSSVKRVPVEGGAAKIVVERGLGGTWSSNGTILFTYDRKIYQVPALGGTPSLVAEPDSKDAEIATAHPEFLPDGNHFIYLARHENEDQDAIYLREIGSRRKSRLVSSNVRGVYASGYLLYARGRSLFAQQLDLTNQQLTGESLTVADDLAALLNGPQSLIGFSVSENGVLAYRSMPSRRLAWYDRAGTRTLANSEAGFTGVVLSPDGRHALQRYENRLCVRDLMAGALNCINLAGTVITNAAGSWSPDSRRIVITSRTAGRWELREFSIDSGSTRVLYSAKEQIFSPVWSGDGRFITFHSVSVSEAVASGGTNVFLFSLSGEPKPRLLFHTPAHPDHFSISHDGRWMAYASNDLGLYQIYITAIEAPENRIQVSTLGGVQPEWRKDGKELYYLTPDGVVCAVEFTARPPARAGKPRPLFRTYARPAYIGRQYSPTADGGRFLFLEPDPPQTGNLTVLLNWTSIIRDGGT